MNVAVTTAAEGFPRLAFTVDEIARDDVLNTPALPGFAIRLRDIA
jgi:hypothetical protein